MNEFIRTQNQKISEYDADLSKFLEAESNRQEEHIELIASENYASKRVLEAQGSVLTNKYAEGYPSKRYYGGCEHVDGAETLAIERAKTLFSAKFANVQPHSGASANAAVFLALMNPGDTFLGMALDQGGHLTHGSKVNFSGKNFNAIQYGLDKTTGDIDYAEVRKLALEHKPKMIVAGFSAFMGIVDWKLFREIADEVGAFLMVDMAHVSGLVAGGVYPNPVEFAHVVTSTTHKSLRGPRSGIILSNEDEEFQKKLNFAVFPGSQGGPLMHVIAAKAVCFKEAMTNDFKEYQKQIISNAKIMCEQFISRGFNLVQKDTDNHLILMDLRNKNITGKEVEELLGTVNITVNKNSIPNDPESPFVTSGIRIGTPAMTTRGFKNNEAKQVVDLICDTIEKKENSDELGIVKNKVKNLCKKFPVYK
ncbi:MAG: serine hydroxymethyltransferase [Gammaproteobacteria bacterium TMED112]|nr:MAG: serine hydroxymethyltransferase [Gammaproteobacteria bacterium TMED112]|tara:strand:+ start:687 stop:1952 length:1266 start_codon:yes stop_codon:yes gene_type:complete